MMNAFLPTDVLLYLNKYQIQGWYVQTNLTVPVKSIIVIPALCEYENMRILLNSLKENNPEHLKKSLILFVINNTTLVNPEIKKDNLLSISMLKSIIEKEDTADEFISGIIHSKMNLGFIDASSAGKELPDRSGGVGLARKIGMDLALTLFDYHSPGKNILICLDADCKVQFNYLEEINKVFHVENFSAGCIRYCHLLEGSTEQQLAICCYEIFLRYYVLGLKYAGSNYAFHTVGSSMACDHTSYIKAEGMNKLKAAEDFYFLEKLAKNFPIGYISKTTVFPSPRGSWRVPFGTGQRVNRFLSHQQDEYLLYNPESFLVLKSWLELFNSEEILSSEEYLNQAAEIYPQVANFLEQQNFKRIWDSILRNNKKTEQINHQKRIWFDGFKTLKMIHFLRDNSLALIGMFEAVDTMLKYNNLSQVINRKDKVPPLNTQIEYLQLLRMLT